MKRISFKLISGFERYRIYSNGKIWDSVKCIFCKLSDNGHGYLRVYLASESNKYTMRYVHRLVAQAFCYNDDPEHKTCVNHKDENKTNNNAYNLEWCTYVYNLNYGSVQCRHSFSISGENNPFYNKHHSEETKQARSIAASGENNPFYNKHHSEETKARWRIKYNWLYNGIVVFVGNNQWAGRKSKALNQIWTRGDQVS